MRAKFFTLLTNRSLNAYLCKCSAFVFLLLLNLTSTIALAGAADNSPVTMSTSGPVSLNYATYFGQSINNVFHDVAVDAAGNSYVIGSTISQGFDAVVVKYDPTGAVVWQKFLGGSDAENYNPNDAYDYGKITLDAAGNIYVTGITASTNFPTSSPFQATHGGGLDAYVSKLDNDGNILLSSFLGSAGDENIGGAGGIAVDAAGNIFVAGTTTASGFFGTAGAHQSTFSGGSETDIFIVKITADFSSISGTYWGDQEIDVVRDLKIDPSGNIWIAGFSNESGISLPGQQPTSLGVRDGILIGFNNNLAGLVGGTFYGGQFDDEINGLDIDASGNLYITGSTFSTNTSFPTVAAFQSSYIGGQEAFAAKLTNNCALTWSTYIGAGQNEEGFDAAVDGSGNLYISGTTSSLDFPVKRTAQETYNTLTCEDDGFVFKFNADGTQDWATYYGGWRKERPYGIAVNNSDQVNIVGRTESTDLPVTNNAALKDPFTAGINAFLARLEIACPSTPIIIHSTENATYYDQFWCSGYNASYKEYFASDSCGVRLIAPPGYSSYSWKRDGNAIAGTSQYLPIPNPYSGTVKRVYEAIINDGNDCASASNSVETAINWVRPMCGFGSLNPDHLPHNAEIIEGTSNEYVCPGDAINYMISADGFCEAQFQWQKDFVDIPGAVNATYNVTEPGCYRIAIKNGFTDCTVYSKSKRFITVDTVILNDYYSNGVEACLPIDTLKGCASVFIKARIETCDGCSNSPRGLDYSFYKDGVLVTSNQYGYYSTTIEGTYRVEVSNGSCTIVSNTVVAQIQPTEKPVWVLPTSTPACKFGQDSMTFAVSHPAVGDSASFRFNFSYPTPDIVTLDSFVTVATADLTTGCMDVRVTTRDGCSSRGTDIEVHDTLTPIINILGTTCVPTVLSSLAANSCTLDSVLWYKGDSLVSKAGYDSRYTATEEGEYILKIKNACGEFTSDTVTLSGNLPSAVVSPAGPICLPVDLSVSALDDHVVAQWYRNPTYSSCNLNVAYKIPNQNGTTFTASLPGYYYVSLTDTLSGCVSSCSNIVEVQRSVAGASLSPSSDIYFCDGVGTSNVTFNVTPASPSFSYQWYRNSNPIAGATAASYTTNAEGVYRVYLENDCDNAFTPVVSIFSVPNPVLTIDRPDTVYLCSPDSVLFNTTSTQPLIYQWYYNDVLITDAVDSMLNVINPGKYTVLGINNNTQCEDWSQEVYLLNSPTINADIAITPSCTGPCTGAIAANVTGGVPFPNGSYQYLWNDGSNTSSISNACEGNYSVTITDKIGCEVIKSIIVDAGFTYTASVDSISCFGQNDGKISIVTSGGKAPFSYNWSNSATTNIIDNLGIGNYAATITDSLNCSTTFSASLTQPTALNITLTPTDQSCHDHPDGSISAVISGGTPPYSLNWSSPVTLDSAMLSSGNYSVTLTDANNCELIETTDIHAPTELTLDFTITNALDCGNSTDGAISVTASGGTMPYQYLWEDGSTSPNRSGLIAGNYFVTITDQNSCAINDTIVLDPAGSFMMQIIDSTALSCYGANDGSVTLAAIGGAAPYTYYVNGDSSDSSTIKNLASGNLAVYIEDNNGCQTATDIVNITSPDTLTIFTNLSGTSCPGGQDGSAELLVSGGTAPYSFIWNTGATESSYDTLAAGNYSVTVSDANNCQKAINFEITQPNPIITDFSIMDNSCFAANDGAITINTTSGGTAPYTYTLSDSAGVGNSSILTDLAAGKYILNVIDSLNCIVNYPVTIQTPELLNVSLNIEQNLVCLGGSDGIIVSEVIGGTLPYNYLWTDGTTTDTIFNLGAGMAAVTIIDANNCQVKDSIFLTEGPSIDFTIAAQSNISCFGAGDGSITLDATGGTAPYTYFTNANSNDSSTIVDLQTGEYTVYIEDSNGCKTDTTIVNITSPDTLSIVTNLNATSCPGGQDGRAELLVSGGTAPYKYSWNTDATNSTIDTLAAGNYSVTISDAHNCQKEIDFEIIQPDPIVTDFSILDNSCFAADDGAVTINTTTGGTAPYVYTLADSMGVGNSPILTDLPAGKYILNVTDSANCVVSYPVNIQTPEVLTVNLNIAQELVCFGGSDGIIAAEVTGGTLPYNYLWANGTTMDSTFNIASGTMAITVTDTNNCLAKDSIILVEGPYIELLVQNPTDVSCFGFDDGSFSLYGTGGTEPYEFFSNSINTFDHFFGNQTPDDYEVYTTDANGCLSEAQIITISEPTALSVITDQTIVRCFGEANGTATLSPSGGISGYQYNWSNGMTDSFSNQLTAGIYEVSVTDKNGCELVSNIEIDQPDALNTSYEIFDNLCFGEEFGSVVINNTQGGTFPYEHYLNEDVLATGSSSFEDLFAGQYELLTIDSKGCEYFSEVNIEEPGLFELSLGDDVTINLGENIEFDLDISNGVGESNLFITPDDLLDCGTNQLLSDCPNPTIVLPTENMRYEVTLTDENGCIAQDDIFVKIARNKSGIFLPNVFRPGSSGENDIFYVQANPSVEMINKFTIHNRWGGLVFSAENFSPNDKSNGWDGSFKGQALNSGVFIWILEYTSIDGKKKQAAGDILILK